MAKYKAYPEYKDSEIEWLGKIPSGWLLKKAKYIFQRVQRPLRDIDGVVTAFRDGQVTLRTNRRTDGFTNSVKEIGYQGVRRNDLVIHAMDGFAGAIGISDSDGKCSPVCSVCIPWENQSVNMHFYGYLVRQLAVTDFILSLAKGIRERSTEFRFSEFSGLMLPIPPIYEQNQIATFLDHETAKIDNLIEKQQQLIALLKEKRQAVISHAVTKGLNPDVPMKDSGVEWLGEVPEHWDVSYLKYVIANEKNAMVDGPFGSSVNTETDYVEQGIPVIRTVNITNLGFSSENLKFMRYEKYIQLKRHSVRPNDVLFSKVGTIGNACILPDSIPEAILSTTGSCKITLEQSSVIPEYLVYVIQSMNEQLMQIANSNVQPFLNMSNIRGLNIPLPKLDEQKDILQAININLLKIDDLIDKASKFELLLQERRTALISAAVTGKIDVRDWVAPETQKVEEPQEATA